jgi:pectin methylesterase-like acyl-CoA thioesterase
MKKTILLFAFLCLASSLFATTIIVDINGGGQFTSIQAGINAANTNDTVKVWPGTYFEQVNLNKMLYWWVLVMRILY